MADNTIAVQSLPDSGSQERVAFNLMHQIRVGSPSSYADKDAILDLYAECLEATRGYRNFR